MLAQTVDLNFMRNASINKQQKSETSPRPKPSPSGDPQATTTTATSVTANAMHDGQKMVVNMAALVELIMTERSRAKDQEALERNKEHAHRLRERVYTTPMDKQMTTLMRSSAWR